MTDLIKPIPSLKMGWISYFNLLPLKNELIRLAGQEIEFVKGTPAQVNRWLGEGKVALGPCSSVCLLKTGTHEMAFPLGIASNGPVSSVYIGVHRESAEVLEQIRSRQTAIRELFRQGFARHGNDARKIASFVWSASAAQVSDVGVPPAITITPASATSAALGRILYRLWFGPAAFAMRAAETTTATTGTALASSAGQRPLELLIGDEALARKGSFWHILDLGELWRELTDLPFVFAVWQTAKQPLNQIWRQRIFEAAELAQARMRVEPSVYFPDMPATDVLGHSIDLAAYWKHIQYRLGPQHFRGLALYLCLARCMMPSAVDDAAVAKIMRWEALGEGATH